MASLINSIVLERGNPFADRMREAARRWRESGGAGDHLLTGRAFFMAQCWFYASDRSKPQSSDFRQDVSDFLLASKTALGGEEGWNAMLSRKEFCSECRMKFRLENLGICTECAEYVCGACRQAHKNCAGEIVG